MIRSTFIADSAPNPRSVNFSFDSAIASLPSSSTSQVTSLDLATSVGSLPGSSEHLMSLWTNTLQTLNSSPHLMRQLQLRARLIHLFPLDIVNIVWPLCMTLNEVEVGVMLQDASFLRTKALELLAAQMTAPTSTSKPE